MAVLLFPASYSGCANAEQVVQLDSATQSPLLPIESEMLPQQRTKPLRRYIDISLTCVYLQYHRLIAYLDIESKESPFIS
jgi:hypothetical protein